MAGLSAAAAVGIRDCAAAVHDRCFKEALEDTLARCVNISRRAVGRARVLKYTVTAYPRSGEDAKPVEVVAHERALVRASLLAHDCGQYAVAVHHAIKVVSVVMSPPHLNNKR